MARIASTTTAGVDIPGSGMTLDALMARQKALADAQGQITAPRNIQSPWQGAAQMAQAFFGARQEAGVADQLTQGRAKLAEIMGGIDPTTGPTQAQLAQAYQLDPDLSVRLMEQAQQARRDAAAAAAAIANREDQQKFSAEQQAGQQQFTAGQSGKAQEFSASQQEDQQASAVAAAEANRQAAIDAAALKTKEDAAKPTTDVGKINADFAKGAFGDPATPGAAALRDQALKKATAIPTPAGVNADRKALWGQQDDYIGTATSIGKLKRAQELLKQGIFTGYTAGAKTMYGNADLPGGDKEMANRTKDFNSIMNKEAITAMAQQLKGATTDTEMARFIENMNDPTLDPKIKQQQIEDMLAKSQSFNELQAARIKELGGEIPQAPAAPGGDEEGKLLQSARDAIAAGADAALVKKRLVDKGGDPGKL